MKFEQETNFAQVEVIEVAGDLPEGALTSKTSGSLVGIDTETSGLDWSNAKLGLIQVYFQDLETVYLIRPQAKVPKRLKHLLASDKWLKIFHFALFDLRFLDATWGIAPSNIRCTKIASKLLAPGKSKHRLADLLESRLGVEISKDEDIRTSDWTAESLSQAQLSYAALDALYLPRLFQSLEDELRRTDLESLASRCFSFIPTQLRAERLGIENLFGY